MEISPETAEPGNIAQADAGSERVSARRVGVLVLGMHRSGTSAMTRMLSLLGCSLPKNLMPANPTNSEGHWESDPIAQFNDEIFAQVGTHWDDWLPVNPRLPETLIWPSLVARGRKILREEFAQAPLFVLKDPRICKLAGFWTEVLVAEGIEPVFVLPLRNPLEVARSLVTRDGADEHHALLIWLRHVLTAEKATRGRTRVFTDYAALLDNWESLAVRLSDGLGLAWPRVSAISGSEISQFLTPDLRHHVSQKAELDDNPSISRWVRKTYAVLLDWARHGEKPADHSILDQISREFDDAGIAFARPMLNAGLAVQRAVQADAECAALAEQRDSTARRLSEVEAEYAHLFADRQTRMAERDELAAHRDALAAEREQLNERLAEVATQLAVVGIERDARSAERDELAGQGAALAEERDDLTRRLGNLERHLAEVAGERDMRTAERNELAGERAALAKARDDVAWRLGEVEAEFGRVCGERDARTAERDQLAVERAAMADERDKVAWRLGEVEAELAGAKAENAQARAQARSLENDLAAAHAGADAQEHRLAVTESTLRQREEEIAQLGAELEASRREMARQAAAAGSAREDADRQHRDLRAALAEAERRREESLAELVALTRQLQKSEKARELEHDAAQRQMQLAEQARNAQAELEAKHSDLQVEFDHLRKALTEAEQRHAESSEELARAADQARNAKAELAAKHLALQAECRSLRKAIAETLQRQEESSEGFVVLTRKLQASEQILEAERDRVEWVRNVFLAVERLPWWWHFLPPSMRRRLERDRLRRRGLFDADAYMAQYPDVVAMGSDPLRHYVRHGIMEGRKI